MSDRTIITLNALDHGAERNGIRYAFFTRQGGVSGGIYGSLNCGFGSRDADDNVAQNRAIAAGQVGVAPEQLISCYQVHGITALTVDAPWHRRDNPKADAMVTTEPGVALGVLAADCAPVLFTDPEARVIGAAHGGWRGSLAGVMEATVAAMVKLGARTERVRAGIGPCIGPASYEVGPEFPVNFQSHDAESVTFFKPAARDGHFLFDLPGYIAHRLRRLGVAAVEAAPHDTAAEEALFFSYRRACLRGETDYGRGLAAIALAK